MLQTATQMSPLWASALVWLIYGFATLPCEPVMGHKDCQRKTCGGLNYDSREAVCCENKLHQGIGLTCCGQQAFSPENATCCKGKITDGLSEKIAHCCGTIAFDPLNEICCESTVNAKPSPKTRCCGQKAIDVDNQLCCGKNNTIHTRESMNHKCCEHNPFNSKTHCCSSSENNLKLEILPIDSQSCKEDSSISNGTIPNDMLYCGRNQTPYIKHSEHHKCCGHDQYNSKTQCCCGTTVVLTIQPINSSCCVEQSGVQQQKDENKPNCTEPEESLCGSLCYNPKKFGCCERNQANHRWSGASGSDTVPEVYDRHKQICCDGHVSAREPWMDKCCGKRPYSLAQRGVLCCNNTLYTDREDGEECSEVGSPYNPRKETICCSQFHGLPGQHCCGTEIYRPHVEICCDGHRLLKEEKTHCCGVQAYDIKNQQMKCCGGNLYNLTLLGILGQDMQCCGSSLINQSYICCSSEDKEMLYSKKTGFRCCSHFYYDTSLWSCCAGKLSLAHHSGRHQNTESTLLSLNNLNQKDLCNRILIGTVESVSQDSISFRNALEVDGSRTTMKPLPLPHILKIPDHCNSPKLIPGKTYFFNETDVFTDYNHDSFIQSLHLIFSKCSSGC